MGFPETPGAATLGSQMAKKLTFGIAFMGALGAGAFAYAMLRKPRYLYDGEVVACEGSEPVYGVDQDCNQVVMKRGSGSGKVRSPFTGTVVAVETWKKSGLTESPMLVLKSDSTPTIFKIVFDRGAPMVGVGTHVKAGEVIGQSEWLRVSAARQESGGEAPLPPSAWLVANGLYPAKMRGKSWCEDEYQQIVPRCPGLQFRAPELPSWSLRTVRMTIQ